MPKLTRRVVAAVATLAIVGGIAVALPAAQPEPAGAQSPIVNGPSTAWTSEGWTDYSGWSWPSWQIAGGGSAGFRAMTRLDTPRIIRAGQQYQYRRCVTWIDTAESGSYEVGLRGGSIDGSYFGSGTVYSQGGWNGTSVNGCRYYTATAPSAGLNKTIRLPAAAVSGDQAVGYAGSCCGGWGMRNAGYTGNNSFVADVLVPPSATDDGVAPVAQGGMTSVDVLANDTGFGGTSLNPPQGTATGLSITTQATLGVCFVNQNKVFYFHNGGATGADQCTYSVNQAETDDAVSSNAAVSAVVRFAVSGPPVANNDALTVTEDAPVTFDPRVNDTEPESQPITITGVQTTGTQGTVTFTGSSITYDPGTAFHYLQAGQTATTTFGYTASDPQNVSDTATVTVTITGLNDAPVAADDTVSTGENGPSITIDPRLNDSDVDTGDTRTVTAVDTTGTQGSVTFTGSGVTYTPTGYDSLANGATATTSFGYTITDSQGGTAQATVNVTIVGTNDAPIAVDDTVNAPEDGPAAAITPLDNDSDPDTGDTYSVQSASVISGGGTVTVSGNTVTFDPAGDFEDLSVGDTRTALVRYTVVDAAGATSSATISVVVQGANDNPVAIDDAAAANEDGPAVSIDVLTAGINDSDIDQNDTLSVTNVSTPSAGTASLVGNTVVYDPAMAFESLAPGQTGTATFTYDISDGNGGTSTATVTVTVFGANDAPTPIDDTATAPEDGPAASIPVLDNDTDPDNGDSVNVLAVGDAAHGTASWNPGDAQISYLPDPTFYAYLAVGETATDTFTYTVVDEYGSVASAVVVVTITGVNNAPAALDDTGATDEGTAVTLDVVAPNDSDPDTTDTLSISAVTQPTPGGSATYSGNEVTFDPNGDFEDLAVGETRDATFTYTISDGNGGSATANVTITVTGTNDVPTAVDDTATTPEGSPVTFDPITPNDTDPDTSDQLVVTAVSTASPGGIVTFGPADITFDPNGDFEDLAVGETRDATFTYTVSDGNGAASTATVTVTVTGENDNPVATDDTATTDEDTPLSIDVLTAGIADSDVDTSDVLSVASVDTSATLGSAVVNGNLVDYDPGTAFQYLAVGETATDTFTYTISDGNGGTSSATVTVTVNGVNDAPTAVDDADTTSATTPVVHDVIANDTDPDTSDVGTVTGVTQPPTGGSVTFSGANVRFDPGSAYVDLAVDETRDAVFTYTMSDGHGGTATATVTITVTGVNDAPNAVDDQGATDEDTPVTVDVVGANDTDPDTTDVLAITSVTQPATGGAITFDGHNITFDPGASYHDLAVGDSRDAVFTYTVDDGNGSSDTAIVTITVAGVNDAPTATDDAAATDDVTAVTIDALPNDTDPDAGDVLSLSALDTTGLKGAATIDGSSIVYDPAGVWNQIGSTRDMLLFEDETDTVTFGYTIEDADGATSSATITVTVTGTLSRTADSDDGGVPDWVELLLGTDPADPGDDPLDTDTDGGGVPDWVEIIMGTDPADPADDPLDTDTDGGGVPDWIEIYFQTDITDPADEPFEIDSDGNGIPDWHELDTCQAIGCESLPPAPTDCPENNGQLDLLAGTPGLGETIEVEGKEPWLKYSKVTYYVCSTPQMLKSAGSTSTGLAPATLELPTDLDPGKHVVFGIGLQLDGSVSIKTLGFVIEDETVPTTPTTEAPATTAASSATTTAAAKAAVAGKTQAAAASGATTARTGASIAGGVLAALALLLAGFGLILMARRRKLGAL